MQLCITFRQEISYGIHLGYGCVHYIWK